MKYLLALAVAFSLTIILQATDLQSRTQEFKRVDQESATQQLEETA